MDKQNILNGYGYLTDEERKEKLEHGCNYFTFESCLDLSQTVRVIPYGNNDEYSLELYSRDLASFITWWSHFVLKDLNGFSGFHNVKFRPVGFKITK
jgi:hypothetical protein